MSMRAENAFPMTVKKIVGKKIALFPTIYAECFLLYHIRTGFGPGNHKEVYV